MRITKTLSAELSKLLCAPKKEANIIRRNEIEKIIFDKYKMTLPKKLLIAFAEFPEYFTSRYHFHYSYEFRFTLNAPRAGYSSVELDYFATEDKQIIQKLIESHLKYVKTVNQKEKELESAILSFSTFAKLEAGFPEAYKLIPKHYFNASKSLLPAKNIDILKAYVKEKPSVIK